MTISAYFYQTFFASSPVEMYLLDLQNTAVKISYDLNSFGICEFSLPLDADIQEWRKIKVYADDSLIFSWYVFQTVPVLDRVNRIIQVQCNSEKHYLSRRSLLASVNINPNANDHAIQLQTQYNSNGDARTYETDASTMSIQWWVWATWYDVINDACESAGTKRDVRDGKLIIKKEIWQNKTYGMDFQEIVYTPYESNVSSMTTTRTYSDANVVIWIDTQWNTYIYPTVLPSVITSVETKEFRDGNLAQATENYYNTLWNINTTYNMQIEQWSINANIGDIVRVRIEWFWKYDIVSSVYVVKKTIEYTNATKVETYEVSETAFWQSGFSEKLRKIQTDLRRIQTS